MKILTIIAELVLLALLLPIVIQGAKDAINGIKEYYDK